MPRGRSPLRASTKLPHCRHPLAAGAVPLDASKDFHPFGETPVLSSVFYLSCQEALQRAGASVKIDFTLAPGSVEVRLRGREPEFVVTPPPGEPVAEQRSEPADAPVPLEDDDGALWRINVRMPDRIKPSIERAARQEGLSVNAWLVRAAAAAVGRSETDRGHERRAPQASNRHTGWAR